MSHVESHTAKIKKIPAKKLKYKIIKSGAGVLVFILGLYFPRWFPEYPVWAGGILMAFGGFIFSEDVVRSFFGFLPAVVRDMYAAVRGKE